MKLTMILFLTAFMNVYAIGYGQKITLLKKDVPLTEVLKAIRQQSGYNFVYNQRSLKNAKNVSISLNDADVEEALKQSFEGQPFTYEVLMKTVIIKPFIRGNSVLADIRVGGTVTDGNGAPLAGVSIKVKGSTAGAATDPSGKYQINAPENGTLVFSFVGFKTQEIVIGGSTRLDVQLIEDEKSLEETVIIGYQKVKKADLTGSIGQVNMSDLNKAPVSSFTQALAGRVSGVQVSSSDGQPGGNMSIIIRGAASINNSIQPLYVIDGFATTAIQNTNINPDDIESITILKDAAATAIYGSRATNGVVVIETKSGKVGKPIVTYNTSYGSQFVSSEIDLMGPYEFVKYQFELNPADATLNYLTQGNTLESYKDKKGIYWPDQVIRTGTVFINDIAVRGGSADTKYAISGGSYDQKGVFINTGYKKYQGRVKVDQKISNKLKAGLSVDYTDVDAFGMNATSSPSGGISSAVWFRTWVYRPIAGSNTPYDLLNTPGDAESMPNSSDIRLNPRITTENEFNHNAFINFNANAYLDYNIMKHLVLRVTGVKNSLRLGRDEFYNSNTIQASPLNTLNSNGIYGTVYQLFGDYLSNENTLTYNKLFNKAHALTVIGGNSQTSYKSRSMGHTGTQLPVESQGIAGLDQGVAIDLVSTASSNALSSFFGIVDYNYKSKYYLKAAMRADGSSKFAERWGYFPAAAVAWSMHNEDFMKHLAFVSNSKLRVSYGITGNNRIGDFDWQSQLDVGRSQGYPFNNQPVLGASVSSIENKGLRWEKTKSMDIGYELGLFENRIEFTIDAYSRKTEDLLITGAPVSAHTGFPSATKNIGSLLNRGLEFSFNTVNIKSKDFSWRSSFNITFNKNKIVKLDRDERFKVNVPSFDVSFGDMYLSEVGQPIGMMFGYAWDGNYQYADFDSPTPGVYRLKASVPTNGIARAAIQPGDIKYKDLNGDGVVNSLDRTVIGRGQALHYGGFSNNFDYKGFSLNVFFQWSYGNNLYNANRLTFEGNSNGRTDLNQYASYIDRWSPTNQNSKNYRAGGGGQVGYHSSRVVEDGSYLRLKTVSMAYTLPAKYIKNLYLSSLSLNVSAQNLFVLTNYSGIDPEVSTRNPQSIITPGFDYSPYPQAKTIVLGLNAKF